MADAAQTLLRQKEIIQLIQHIQINFNKDSAVRKTEEYIKTKLQSLDDLFQEFEMNNEELMLLPDKTGDYFTKNIYEDTKNTYLNFRKALITYTTSGVCNNISPAEELICEQRANFRAFLRVINDINTADLVEKWELKDELRSLQTRWKNIDALHLKIDSILQGSNQEYEDQYLAYEHKFKVTKRTLYQKLSAAAHQYEATPQMEIPTFHGDYTQWPTFLDLYKSGIHDNPRLSKGQKMQHLKGKLRDEAQRLVQHLHVSSDNYDTAWEILNRRYNNKQILFTNQIEVFLNQPAIQKQSSAELQRLHDITMESVHAIHNLGVDTTMWDPILVHLLLKKLDSITRSEYLESRKTPRELASFDELITFLEAKFTALEPIYDMKKKEEIMTSNSFNNIKERPLFGVGKQSIQRVTYPVSSPFHCVLCNSDQHALYQCKKFESMSATLKLRAITKHHVCKNCLYVHEYGVCKSNKRCKLCNEQHNTLLHEVFINNEFKNDQHPTTSQQSSNNVTSSESETLLTTVKIRVQGNDKQYITLRALLDQGSQTTLISENAAQRLGLPRHHLNASVTGVGTTTRKSKGRLQLQCKSIHDDYSFTTDALIMPRLVNDLPNNTFAKKNYSHLQHIKLADPDYNISQPIDILLDANIYSKIIMNGLIKGSANEPIAQQTKLGWILSGAVTPNFNCNIVLNNINDIANFEEIALHNNNVTFQEKINKQLYASTSNHVPDGRCESRLLMKKGFKYKSGKFKAQQLAEYRRMNRYKNKKHISSQGNAALNVSKYDGFTRILRIPCNINNCSKTKLRQLKARSAGMGCKKFDTGGTVYNAPVYSNYSMAM